ncbi:unnamed protein product [Rotaria sp. Silwood2]|nr:unnamed protein product [Rotaria sp. Silwood2]
MSLQLDVNEPPLHNASANPIPLMSFYAPPCSTKSHPQSHRGPPLQRKPRLYSTVCSQAPQANTNTSQHVTNHRSDTSSTTFNTIDSSTQQQEHATFFSPNNDQPSPGLSSAFNTEMIELSLSNNRFIYNDRQSNFYFPSLCVFFSFAMSIRFNYIDHQQ